MWLADRVMQPKAGFLPSIHGAVTSGKVCCSVRAASAWRLLGLISWISVPQRTEDSRKWHIHQPPLLWLARPLLLSLITEISAEKQRGQWGWAVSMLIHTAALWKHGEASWEARESEREAQRRVFHSTLAVYYPTILLLNCELAWQWTGFIMEAAGVMWAREDL